MNAEKSVAQRLGLVLEALTCQSGRISRRPEYGSWLLGRASESQRRRRVRIRVILTALVLIANLIGIGVVALMVTVTFPEPSVFAPDARWITWVVAVYVAAALVVGTFWATRRVVHTLRWSIEGNSPTAGRVKAGELAPPLVTGDKTPIVSTPKHAHFLPILCLGSDLRAREPLNGTRGREPTPRTVPVFYRWLERL